MLTALALLSVLLQDPAVGESRLRDFQKRQEEEREKDDKKARPAKEKSSQERPCDGDDDWDPGLTELVARPFFLLFFSPFLDQSMRYDDYPYATSSRYFQERGTRPLAFEFGTRYGRIAHDLQTVGAGLTLRLPSGCDFRAEGTEYIETPGSGERERMTLGRFEMNYGLGGSERRFNATLGWGVAILDGEIAEDAGLSGQARAVWFVSKPFRLQGSFAVLGLEKTALDASIEAGVHFDRFSLDLGWRTLHSGGEDLDGPTLGVSLFF